MLKAEHEKEIRKNIAMQRAIYTMKQELQAEKRARAECEQKLAITDQELVQLRRDYAAHAEAAAVPMSSTTSVNPRLLPKPTTSNAASWRQSVQDLHQLAVNYIAMSCPYSDVDFVSHASPLMDDFTKMKKIPRKASHDKVHTKSPIHFMEGVFFLPEAAPGFSSSYYGKKKLCVRPHLVITDAHNLYFADFLCFKRGINGGIHYVTVVVCERDTKEDIDCAQTLIQLDKKLNPFFHFDSSDARQVWKMRSGGIIVELFYAHDFLFDNLEAKNVWTKEVGLKQRKIELEYFLDPLERTSTFIGPLKLENTISSTGVTDFLLLRKNSSRGDFDRNPLLRTDLDFDEFPGMQQYSKATTPGIYHMASSAEMLGDQAGRYDHPLRSLDSPGMETLDTFPNFPNIGIVLEEFTVDRLHRIKPKWPAKFIIREDCVEVNPILLDLRKKGSAKAAQKFIQIPIGMIASVEVHHAERSNSKRIVRITYLRVPAAMQRTFLQAIMQCDSITMESALPHSPLSSSVDGCLIAAPGTSDVGRVHWHLGHIYEASSWKSFQMEANSDDAWRIGVRINDIMDGRQSQSRSKIRKSEHGDRFSPSKRLLEPATFYDFKYGAECWTFRHLQSSKKKTAKRITSTAGAVLSRMLSRQE
ncbi:stress-activated map kinase-interacting protein 1 like protein [Ditylenchus destructor]|uniref:Stress-activated map kinase-interacting protein 1 like protein n=1 Tax=Ditylenchus destructor TaxID=166010 RepID=A0AAD4R1I0_9BILA|nr:stress-activated map kinase-interacting protein 1 like protein [Ditylenchus destructor]